MRSPRRRTCWLPRTRSARSCPMRSRPRPSGRWWAGGRRHGVIDPDVLWSCTNCGACVEECPVDIEHIDHIDGMRRHQVLIESAFPVEAAGMLRNLENKGDPWGMGGARRADWIGGTGLRGPRRRRQDRPGCGVPVLGGLRGRAGGPGAQDDQGDRLAAAHRGGEVRRARPGRDLHRRPGPADRQRVRVLDAGRPEHRDAERGGRADDRGLLPALLQHHRERVPAARRELRGDSPHPAAGPAGGRRGS